ncbi:MAG: hypothetical protein JSS10_07495 [Verrucomicrobia bacterium]|nr:hypothetical protein [Verrucomicrobiota bacterium]
MKPVDRQKICPNCDGRIAYDATQCTYCFATLPQDNTSSKIFGSSQDNLTAIYTPPYPTKAETEPKTTSKAAVYPEKESPLTENAPTDVKSFWPLLLLCLGGNLLTLGILQFFFSDRGVVRLEINGSYWFLMVLLSLPLLYLGLKNASKNDS